VSGSGISWAMCKSALRSRQITMPEPHHSVFFTGRMPFLPPNQQRQSTDEGNHPIQVIQVQTVHKLLALFWYVCLVWLASLHARTLQWTNIILLFFHFNTWLSFQWLCPLLHGYSFTQLQLKRAHTCRVGASSTWYVADCLRLRPRVVNRVKHLYLWAVQFTVGVVRPCSITTTAEYVHFVADAGCRVKVPPSRRLTTLNTTTHYKGIASNPKQIPHLHAMITGCFYYCNHFCLIAIFPGKPASAGFPLARSTQPVPVRQPQGINAVDSNFMKWYCSQIIGTFIYT